MNSLANLMWAIVLVIALADLAFQASPDLSTNPNAVSDLDSGHFWSGPDDLADNLMSNTDG